MSFAHSLLGLESGCREIPRFFFLHSGFIPIDASSVPKRGKPTINFEKFQHLFLAYFWAISATFVYLWVTLYPLAFKPFTSLVLSLAGLRSWVFLPYLPNKDFLLKSMWFGIDVACIGIEFLPASGRRANVGCSVKRFKKIFQKNR